MTHAQIALWVAPLALGAVFFSNSIPIAFTGLFIFGLAAGFSYSGSLYYSLEQGANKGEYGGIHESFIGAGIFVGPLLGASASYFFNSAGAQWTIIGATIFLGFAGNFLISQINN